MLATTHEPLGRCLRPERKSSEGFGNSMQAVAVHGEDANFIDAAEAVLVRAHDAKFAVDFAFEVQHRIDEMLEQTRARRWFRLW